MRLALRASRIDWVLIGLSLLKLPATRPAGSVENDPKRINVCGSAQFANARLLVAKRFR
jgi:hypothetical protein